MENIGLVLEGGGMRGLYTAGVLDYFLDEDLHFHYTIGVSAGACNAVSYISQQKERSKIINIKYANDPRYLGFRNLLKEKSLFGMDFIFKEIPKEKVPFDYEKFFESPSRLVVGTTDCITGKGVYFEKDEVGKDFEVVKASSSLPLVAPIVKIGEYELLDGGIIDPIPIKKSIKDGNTRNVIVLTRERSYRKEPSKLIKIVKAKYRKYPKLVEAMENRYKVYNESLDYIEELEKKGEAIVIRPSTPVDVGRIEKDKDKLEELYQQGYNDAKNCYDQVKEYCQLINA